MRKIITIIFVFISSPLWGLTYVLDGFVSDTAFTGQPRAFGFPVGALFSGILDVQDPLPDPFVIQEGSEARILDMTGEGVDRASALTVQMPNFSFVPTGEGLWMIESPEDGLRGSDFYGEAEGPFGQGFGRFSFLATGNEPLIRTEGINALLHLDEFTSAQLFWLFEDTFPPSGTFVSSFTVDITKIKRQGKPVPEPIPTPEPDTFTMLALALAAAARRAA